MGDICIFGELLGQEEEEFKARAQHRESSTVRILVFYGGNCSQTNVVEYPWHCLCLISKMVVVLIRVLASTTNGALIVDTRA